MNGSNPVVAAFLVLITMGLAVSVACDNKTTPTTPTPPPPPTPVTISAPVLSSLIANAETDEIRPTLIATNAVVTGSAGTITYIFEVSVDQSFPNEPNKSWWQTGIPQGSGGTTSWVVPVDLAGGATFYWRAQATNGSLTSAWSTVADFKTKVRGGSFVGQTVWDPLTDGKSVGGVNGGRFIAGQGWQSGPDPAGLNNFIRYAMPGSMPAGLVEFDLTNIKTHTGVEGKDIKFLSMGDRSTFGNSAFRDHPWKMHIEKRDEDPVGSLKLIWREGCATEGNCDHAFKTGGMSWDPNHIYHWVFRWGGGRILVKVDDVVVLDDGHAGYMPPNFMIELGCSSRVETMPEAIWSNVKISPGTSAGFRPW